MTDSLGQRRLTTILIADIVGYGKLVGLDEAGTLAAMRDRRKHILTPLVREHRGRIVKFMGDGVLIEFPSAINGVQCGVALQERMADANEQAPDGERLVLRVGINLGDVVTE